MKLKTLHTYYHQCNKDYIGTIIEHPELPERIRVLMSHILNAQAIWMDRSVGRKTRYQVWDLHPDANLLPIQSSLEKEMLGILNNRSMEEIIGYQNSKGLRFENTLEDVVFHIFNHGTHHRAQIAYLMSQAGIKASPNDYIFRRRTAL